MATDNHILHALVDLCQAVEKQGLVATPAYERAMQVLRDNVKAGGSDGPEASGKPGTEARHGYRAELIWRLKSAAEAAAWEATTPSLYSTLMKEAADALDGPDEQLREERVRALNLLFEALREQRRWRSCQAIGACRQCVDDGVTLRIKTFLDSCGATDRQESK